ncbi:MAG TPA: formylglycine-generating enzyme family protein, partial [Luteimonas sp.]|nr:formylglycine-generating enzyme family protein [Luteimonas sp.]
RFTDAIGGGARGPRMVVLPHGGFRMGAADDDPQAAANERPQRYVHFDRGVAFSVHEVTVGEFRRFIEATRHRTRADRRGYSMPYDERSGNFIRRSGVDWRSTHAGAVAADNMPVLHVSAADAEAYAAWLSEESGQSYRLPSEAEFEYALRAGGSGRWPWGNGRPPRGAGNFTGGLDQSPGGRRWGNAFAAYGDGHWGAAPVGSFAANAFGVHDLAGNASEWVADCWHDGYRRAPVDGAAWINAGCRTKVVRGGSWASAPAQTRSSWRAPAPVDTTNARVGFRVARDL